MVTWIFAATWPPTPTTLTTRLVPIWHTIKTMSVLHNYMAVKNYLRQSVAHLGRAIYLPLFKCHIATLLPMILLSTKMKWNSELQVEIHRFWLIRKETRDGNIYEEQQDMCPVWQSEGWGKGGDRDHDHDHTSSIKRHAIWGFPS